jgi:hypothetical protein
MAKDEEKSRSSAKKSDELPDLEIHWTASESIDHKRGIWWYVIAAVLVAAAIGVSFWLQGVSFSSISSTVLVVVIFIALLTVSHRPARELHYALTQEGLTIENQLHPFDDFRAFGVHQDGALWQLTLIPVKRFGFSVTMFIHDDQGEAIVDALGARLPMEDVRVDLIDKIVRKLKI